MKADPILVERRTGRPPAEDVWVRLLDRMQSSRAPACTDAQLARVRRAIALGQFHVNSHSLADRLIERLLCP